MEQIILLVFITMYSEESNTLLVPHYFYAYYVHDQEGSIVQN